MGIPVSCTIIARNEVDRIGRAIQSVRGLVDEVVVVDSGSTDGTQALAESLGARVIHNDWLGYGPQKRFAEDAARNDWILNLDADEWLSEPLRQELGKLLSAARLPATSYKMRVTIVYPQRDTPLPFADSTRCLRLYDKRVTRFAASLAHDTVPDRPDTVLLKGRIYHKSFRSVAHAVVKMISYFELQKRESKPLRGLPLGRMLFEFPFQFFKFYIVRRHIFGGRQGFAYAVAIAVSRWLRVFILLGW